LEEFADSALAPNARYDLAWALRGLGQEEAALDLFRQVADGAGETSLRADALFRLAEVRYSGEDYAGAAALYRRITELEGVGFLDKALYKLGWSLEEAGRMEQALEAYRSLVKDHPKSELAPDAAFRAGRMLQELGRHDEAAQHFGAMARDGAGAGELAGPVRFGEAESLKALGRWAAAREAYRAALGAGFEPAYLARYGEGVCAMELGAERDAREALAQVIAQTDTETGAMAQFALGELEWRRGEFEGAAVAFLKVSILYDYPQWKRRGLLRAGRAFGKAGQGERAARYLAQLVEQYPGSEEAGRAKEMLDGME
jgi:TolA-binding protein